MYRTCGPDLHMVFCSFLHTGSQNQQTIVLVVETVLFNRHQATTIAENKNMRSVIPDAITTHNE